MALLSQVSNSVFSSVSHFLNGKHCWSYSNYTLSFLLGVAKEAERWLFLSLLDISEIFLNLLEGITGPRLLVGFNG